MRIDRKSLALIETPKLSLILFILTAFALPISTTLTNILFPLATLSSFFHRHWITQLSRIARHPMAILCTFYFLLYLVITFCQLSSTTAYPIHSFTKMSCFLIAALLLGIYDSNQRLWQYVINAFLIAMVITLGLSYIKYYSQLSLFNFHSVGRTSVFKNHITQNFLFAFSTFIFFYRWIHHYPHRWAYGVLSLLMSYNIFFMSSGRSGYYIFFILCLYFIIQHFNWKKGIAISAVVGILLFSLLLVTSPVFQDRVYTAANEFTAHFKIYSNETSIGDRLHSMENAYQLIKEKPWIGHGAADVFRSYNIYLNAWADFGLLGLCLLLFLLGIQWKYSLSLQNEQRFIAQALILSIALGGLINPWLSDTTELHLYALLTGLVFSGVSIPHKLLERFQELNPFIKSSI